MSQSLKRQIKEEPLSDSDDEENQPTIKKIKPSTSFSSPPGSPELQIDESEDPPSNKGLSPVKPKRTPKTSATKSPKKTKQLEKNKNTDSDDSDEFDDDYQEDTKEFDTDRNQFSLEKKAADFNDSLKYTNFFELVLDEIALEGLDGITLEGKNSSLSHPK